MVTGWDGVFVGAFVQLTASLVAHLSNLVRRHAVNVNCTNRSVELDEDKGVVVNTGSNKDDAGVADARTRNVRNLSSNGGSVPWC